MNMKRAFADDRRMDYCGYREDDQMEVGNNLLNTTAVRGHFKPNEPKSQQSKPIE